jgi:hypothetical protein
MRFRLTILCVFWLLPVQAQVGGTAAYRFLDLTTSPKVAALGGEWIAGEAVADPALAFYNPAQLDSASDRHLSLNYIHYMADIHFGYAAYAQSFRNIGVFAAGMHYVNYGKFTEADMTGDIIGSFSAAEYAFSLTGSLILPWLDSTITVGVNLKPVLSVLEQYSSFGLLSDVGVVYRHPNHLTNMALVIKNIGGQITTYAQGRERVPFEVQLGVSHQLQDAPFCFSMVLQHLERLRMGYNENSNDENSAKHGFSLYADEMMRHIVFGVECTPFRGLILRGGYNYQRRQEMKVASHPGVVGFSWGAGIHLSRFHIDYAYSKWHLAGASNHFAITVDLR